MKLLIFDIWGDFGHFRKFYTTSSPLTFSVPPPTTIYGMLGAILGLNKKEYLKFINGRTTKLAIEILKPIKKTRITLNLIDTKNSGSFHLIKTRTQIKTEFLRNPAYKIYIHLENKELFNNLIENIKNKKTYYTLSLGLANLIANFQYDGEYEVKPLEIANKVNTIIPSRNIKKLEFVEGKKYFKEKLPMDMNKNREVLSYEDIVMEVEGNSIEGNFKNCYKIEIKNKIISFLI
ncbi:MAG: type I-B CRISPR-associated protein Cas5 [Leptospiraceae bacterium]|nr:MAG: type I-B CRISPR-associated protein Cas5 [Leptospiraceae bacterium]